MAEELLHELVDEAVEKIENTSLKQYLEELAKTEMYNGDKRRAFEYVSEYMMKSLIERELYRRCAWLKNLLNEYNAKGSKG